jgi:phosphatidylinositol kinase/protein kinase (PI-3  family)
MLQDDTGKFFHIDFGHFLGHAKVKLGIKRDREPFILSPELRYFLQHFKAVEFNEESLKFELSKKKLSDHLLESQTERFEDVASKAFLKLRQNADVFINLLVLMLVSGMEELDMKHIGYLRKAFFLDVSEEEATVAFK